MCSCQSPQVPDAHRQQMKKAGLLQLFSKWALVHRIEAPKVKFSTTKESSECTFIGGSWLPLVIAAVLFSILFVPYFVVLYRGNLFPFLPFISQVGGSPPQSGIFCILLMLLLFLGYIGVHTLYMAFKFQKMRLEDEFLRQTVSLLNHSSLFFIHLGCWGVLLVSAFPLDFGRKTSEWWYITVLPHLIGSLCIFLGGLFYCIIITYIMALLHPHKRRVLGIRIFLLSLITMLSALQGYTVRDGFIFPGENDIITSCAVEAKDVQSNLSYLISSICEWLLIMAFTVFFITLKDEGRDICVTVLVTERQNEVSKESPETTRPDPPHSTSLKVTQKQPQEETGVKEIHDTPNNNKL